MLKNAGYVSLFALPVALLAVIALQRGLPVGPVVFGLGFIPMIGLLIRLRDFAGSLPDMVFGALDTGLLVVPALWGGIAFGVAGAVAGGVVGDALTDAIAGFFEGSIDESLRRKGITASREAVTTALGKMTGCLLGAGTVLTVAWLVGIQPEFGR